MNNPTNEELNRFAAEKIYKQNYYESHEGVVVMEVPPNGSTVILEPATDLKQALDVLRKWVRSGEYARKYSIEEYCDTCMLIELSECPLPEAVWTRVAYVVEYEPASAIMLALWAAHKE